MAKCEVCGNDYELSFQVVTAGVTHTFDSFECAIHKLAPICAHCGCKIIGHGIEANHLLLLRTLRTRGRREKHRRQRGARRLPLIGRAASHSGIATLRRTMYRDSLAHR